MQGDRFHGVLSPHWSGDRAVTISRCAAVSARQPARVHVHGSTAATALATSCSQLVHAPPQHGTGAEIYIAPC
jgi:hypothetical protein